MYKIPLPAKQMIIQTEPLSTGILFFLCMDCSSQVGSSYSQPLDSILKNKFLK